MIPGFATLGEFLMFRLIPKIAAENHSTVFPKAISTILYGVVIRSA